MSEYSIHSLDLNEQGALTFCLFTSSRRGFVSGTIPTKIAKKGRRAVRQYLGALLRTYREEERAQEKSARKAYLELNVRVAKDHGGVRLEGAITAAPKAGRDAIAITLENPETHRGKRVLKNEFNYNTRYYADDFIKNMQLTDYAMKRAQQELVKIYKDGELRINYPGQYEAAHELNWDKKKYT